MAEIVDLDTTDDNNTGRFPEGMAPSEVNDGARALEGILARWFQDTNGSITASGSSNAFAITSNRTISALANNIVMAFTANHTITGAATLNLNGLGAKSIKRFNGDDLTAGDIISGQPVWVSYKLADDDWYMVSAAGSMFINAINELTEDTNPDSTNDFLALYDASGSTHKKIAPYLVPGALIAIIEDQKTLGTSAQALTSGVDNVRELNTLVFNRDTLVSLSSNRFTLPAGTWEIEWRAPVNIGCTRHQSFLYNQSDSSEVKRGSSGFCDGGDGDDGDSFLSDGHAVVTITASKAFEIRHRIAGTSGFGGDHGGHGTEVYTRVVVRRA